MHQRNLHFKMIQPLKMLLQMKKKPNQKKQETPMMIQLRTLQVMLKQEKVSNLFKIITFLEADVGQDSVDDETGKMKMRDLTETEYKDYDDLKAELL